MKQFHILMLVVGLCLASAMRAAAPERKAVYMFGFAASFTDSVAFITDPQLIDSAYVLQNGFLADRTLYANQLDHHVQVRHDKADMVPSLFWHTKLNKLEKRWQKIRKRYEADPAMRLVRLGADEFQFHLEEYIEPEVIEAPKPEKPMQGDPERQGPPPGGGMGGPPQRR